MAQNTGAWDGNDAFKEGVARFAQTRGVKLINTADDSERTAGVNAILGEMKERLNIDFEAASWPENAAFVVPETREALENCLFSQTVGENGNKAFGLTLWDSGTGRERQLYFNTLKRNVVGYKGSPDGGIINTGVTHHSKTGFYNEVMNCGNDAEIFDLICSKAGKTIKVVKVDTVQGAKVSFKNGKPVTEGLKTFNIPNFDVI